MKRYIILTATASFLTSCGIYTKYQPVSSVPEDLYGQETTLQSDTSSLASLSWRALFTDPYLQSLIETGLENNTDYRVAELQIQEAEASLLAAKLSFLPSFAISPQGNMSSFDGAKASWTYSAPITASWELDIFGRMRNAKRQAQALHAQSLDYKQAVRTQLIASIANNYYTLLMLDELLALSEATAEAWRETVTSARALMRAGQYDEASVSQMEATYYNVQTSVLDLKEQINQTENVLSLILAETPQHIQRGRLSNQSLPPSFAIGVPLDMLASRPDVRMAERTLEAAFYATNQARSSFYPAITLSGSTGWTNSVGTIITNPGKFLGSAIASLTQPPFNRGQLLANLKITKAQQEEAQLSFTQTLLSAGSEVNDALTAYLTSRDTSALIDSQVEALRRTVRSTTLLMEHGSHTYLEVITTRQSILSAQLTQVANHFTELQSLVNLYQALGGGQEE